MVAGSASAMMATSVMVSTSVLMLMTASDTLRLRTSASPTCKHVTQTVSTVAASVFTPALQRAPSPDAQLLPTAPLIRLSRPSSDLLLLPVTSPALQRAPSPDAQLLPTAP